MVKHLTHRSTRCRFVLFCVDLGHDGTNLPPFFTLRHLSVKWANLGKNAFFHTKAIAHSSFEHGLTQIQAVLAYYINSNVLPFYNISQNANLKMLFCSFLLGRVAIFSSTKIALLTRA